MTGFRCTQTQSELIHNLGIFLFVYLVFLLSTFHISSWRWTWMDITQTVLPRPLVVAEKLYRLAKATSFVKETDNKIILWHTLIRGLTCGQKFLGVLCVCLCVCACVSERRSVQTWPWWMFLWESKLWENQPNIEECVPLVRNRQTDLDLYSHASKMQTFYCPILLKEIWYSIECQWEIRSSFQHNKFNMILFFRAVSDRQGNHLVLHGVRWLSNTC